MKKFGAIGVLSAGAAVAILVIAVRNGLVPWEQVNGGLVRGFAAFAGLVLAMVATLPLSYRGWRVKRVRGFVTIGPLTRGERRHNWRLWKFSFALLAIEATGIAIWQVFDHGDPAMTSWAIGALAIVYLVLIPFRHPVELDQIAPPQTPSQMFWAVSDPSSAIIVGE